MAFIKIGNQVINTAQIVSVEKMALDKVTLNLPDNKTVNFYEHDAEAVWKHFTAAATDLDVLAELEARQNRPVTSLKYSDDLSIPFGGTNR